MGQYKTIQLGNAKRLKLKFKNTPDESIPVGQVVIIFEEIVALKVGPYLYDVYPDLDAKSFEQQLAEVERCRIKAFLAEEERKKERVRQLAFLPTDNEPLATTKQKYEWTPSGMKRTKHWER